MVKGQYSGHWTTTLTSCTAEYVGMSTWKVRWEHTEPRVLRGCLPLSTPTKLFNEKMMSSVYDHANVLQSPLFIDVKKCVLYN